ncbi:MAG: hypothetical protein R3C53_18275 [Pirellulaceae bacterium]
MNFWTQEHLRRLNGQISVCLGITLLTTCFSGCSICSPGFIDDYATVGGKWARANPVEGRVGSTLSDSGTAYSLTQPPEYSTDWIEPSGIDGEFLQEGYAGEGGVEVIDGDGFDPSQIVPNSSDSLEFVPQHQDEVIILGDDW